MQRSISNSWWWSSRTVKKQENAEKKETEIIRESKKQRILKMMKKGKDTEIKENGFLWFQRRFRNGFVDDRERAPKLWVLKILRTVVSVIC